MRATSLPKSRSHKRHLKSHWPTVLAGSKFTSISKGTVKVDSKKQYENNKINHHCKRYKHIYSAIAGNGNRCWTKFSRKSVQSFFPKMLAGRERLCYECDHTYSLCQASDPRTSKKLCPPKGRRWTALGSLSFNPDRGIIALRNRHCVCKVVCCQKFQPLSIIYSGESLCMACNVDVSCVGARFMTGNQTWLACTGWTDVPGWRLEPGTGSMAGHQVANLPVSGRIEFVMNNGEGSWDTPEYGSGSKNYIIDGPGNYFLKSGKVQRLHWLGTWKLVLREDCYIFIICDSCTNCDLA